MSCPLSLMFLSITSLSQLQAVKTSTGKEDLQTWIEKLKLWLKEQYSPDNLLLRMSDKKLSSDKIEDAVPELPIWIAAQRAVSRYEGLLSPLGPRRRLVSKLLTWTGLIPSLPEASVNFESDNMNYSENYHRLMLGIQLRYKIYTFEVSFKTCSSLHFHFQISDF
jgi:hypothetical protein